MRVSKGKNYERKSFLVTNEIKIHQHHFLFHSNMPLCAQHSLSFPLRHFIDGMPSPLIEKRLNYDVKVIKLNYTKSIFEKRERKAFYRERRKISDDDG
jgi:hypothetical protein